MSITRAAKQVSGPVLFTSVEENGFCLLRAEAVVI
jgi:hypothetical protein